MAAAPPAAVPSVPEATLRARAGAHMARNFDGIQPSGYTAQFVDLNGDGMAEALIDIRPESGQCGRNCPALILELSGPAPREVYEDLVGGFRPLNSRTQGWRDVAQFGGRVLRWRNGRYQP